MVPFTDVLRQIRKGRLADVASEELNAVVRAVMATGKPGSVTLVLTVKPQSKGDNALIVSATINAKEPQEELPSGIFFANLDGDLLREDPTQQRMFAAVDHDPQTGEVLTA